MCVCERVEMPEIAEVYTTAQLLNEKFKGKTLIGIEHHTSKCLYGDPSNCYQTKVKRIRSRGKKIIFDLASGEYIMVALMMEGKLHLKPANKHLHVTLYFNDGSNLYYCESRPFGGVYYCTGDDELEACLENVGPDLVQDGITEDQWLKTWRRTRSKRTIAELLLDQRIFAGIGNYLRADILYHARIYPMATLDSLTDEDLIILYHSTMKIIGRAVEAKGYSIVSYSLPDGSKGGYESLVYGHDEDVKGRPVEKTKLGQRTIHWVPKVQKRGM
jgi:DNA-formamidopyrimidine glycosylase